MFSDGCQRYSNASLKSSDIQKLEKKLDACKRFEALLVSLDYVERSRRDKPKILIIF